MLCVPLQQQAYAFVNFIDMEDAIHARDDIINQHAGWARGLANKQSRPLRIGFGRVGGLSGRVSSSYSSSTTAPATCPGPAPNIAGMCTPPAGMPHGLDSSGTRSNSWAGAGYHPTVVAGTTPAMATTSTGSFFPTPAGFDTHPATVPVHSLAPPLGMGAEAPAAPDRYIRPSPPVALPLAAAAGVRVGRTASASSTIVPSSDRGGIPLPADMVPVVSLDEERSMLRELDPDCSGKDLGPPGVSVLGPPPNSVVYLTSISAIGDSPIAPGLPSSRHFDPGFLRDVRKALDAEGALPAEADSMASMFMSEMLELASDYIGNTVVQRLFEHGSATTRSAMLDVLAPGLANLGVHKNGTWAAQKIIDCAQDPVLVSRIVACLTPYIPPLLLDKFGNYVVQCLLPYGPPVSDCIFDAITARTWEIAQGRFGARSVRACLENSRVTRTQQRRTALAIVLHAVPLATSGNGALLLIWLLDTSAFPGRFALLARQFAPHLRTLCTHKLANLTVGRIIAQRTDPAASRLLLNTLFQPAIATATGCTVKKPSTPPSPTSPTLPSNHTHPHSPSTSPRSVGPASSTGKAGASASPSGQVPVYETVVLDPVHGSQFMSKLLNATMLEPREKGVYLDRVREVVRRHNLAHNPAQAQLVHDVGLAPTAGGPGMADGSGPGTGTALPGVHPPAVQAAAAAAAVVAAANASTSANVNVNPNAGGNAGTSTSSHSAYTMPSATAGPPPSVAGGAGTAPGQAIAAPPHSSPLTLARQVHLHRASLSSSSASSMVHAQAQRADHTGSVGHNPGPAAHLPLYLRGDRTPGRMDPLMLSSAVGMGNVGMGFGPGSGTGTGGGSASPSPSPSPSPYTGTTSQRAVGLTSASSWAPPQQPAVVAGGQGRKTTGLAAVGRSPWAAAAHTHAHAHAHAHTSSAPPRTPPMQHRYVGTGTYAGVGGNTTMTGSPSPNHVHGPSPLRSSASGPGSAAAESTRSPSLPNSTSAAPGMCGGTGLGVGTPLDPLSGWSPWTPHT